MSKVLWIGCISPASYRLFTEVIRAGDIGYRTALGFMGEDAVGEERRWAVVSTSMGCSAWHWWLVSSESYAESTWADVSGSLVTPSD